jgi:DNA-binding MarR family transcriptional regulator
LALFVGLRVNELIVERGRAGGAAHLRESHGYVIQHLIEAERTITELATRMGVTQQAASKMVTEMSRQGIIEAIAHDDRRAKRIRLTAKGWAGVRFARRARRDVERRLSRIVGRQRYQAASRVLIECLDALGGTERVRERRVRQPL